MGEMGTATIVLLFVCGGKRGQPPLFEQLCVVVYTHKGLAFGEKRSGMLRRKHLDPHNHNVVRE